MDVLPVQVALLHTGSRLLWEFVQQQGSLLISSDSVLKNRCAMPNNTLTLT